MAQKPVLVSFLLLVVVVTLGSSWRDAMTMCQEVHVEPRNEMHLVYAIEASSANEYQQQLDLLTQSAWSAFSVGCDALRCRRRLHAHVFYWRIPKHALEDSLAPLIFRGFRISTHETDFDSAVTRHELSRNSHAFAVQHLTTRAQATRLLHRVGCTSLIANHSDHVI